MTTEAVVHSHRSRSRSRGKQRNLINHPVSVTNDGSTSRTYDSFQSLHQKQEQHQQHPLMYPPSSISFCRRRGTSMESPHSYQYPGQQQTQYFPGSYSEAMYVKRGPTTSQSLHSFPTSSSPIVPGQEAVSFSRGRRMIPGFNNLPMEVSGSVSSVANSDSTLTHRTRGRCMTDSYPLNRRHEPSPSSSSTHFIPISRSMLSSHPPSAPPSSTMSTPRSHPRHHRNKMIVQEKANHSAAHSSSSTSVDSSSHSSQNQFTYHYQYPPHSFQQHQPHPVTQVIRIRPLLHSIPSEVFTNNQLSSGAVSPEEGEDSRSTSQSSVLYLSPRDDNNSEHNENTDNNNHRTHPSLTMQTIDSGDDESKL